MLLSGCIHLSQTNGCVKLSLYIYPSSPESSIFQLEAAGKRLQGEVCDPDDFSGTATNCETEIDFEKHRACARELWSVSHGCSDLIKEFKMLLSQITKHLRYKLLTALFLIGFEEL